MAEKRVPTFTWGKFSKKGKYSLRYSTARLNIWEGAVRSSKTINSIVRWLEYVADGPEGNLLMVGKTERTLKRNILDEIEKMVGKKNFKYNRGTGECFIFGRKIFVAGANDERAQDKIRGMTLAGAYGDELTLWPESFFKMLLSRLSVVGAKFFGTTNPDGPYHWLKTGYIDNEKVTNKRVFSFELEDNPNLDPEYVEDLKREYTGLWYDRFIKGLWVMAQGAIYDMWNEAIHVVDAIPGIVTNYYVGVDYGTDNPTAFILLGEITYPRRQLIVLDEYYWDSKEKGRSKSPSQYAKDFKEFVKGKNIRAILIDPSAKAFIKELQLPENGFNNIYKADNSVIDGIRNVSNFLSVDKDTGRPKLLVLRKCKNLIKEFGSYVWDVKSQLKGEDTPLKKFDHALDALRYLIQTLFAKTFARALGAKPAGT